MEKIRHFDAQTVIFRDLINFALLISAEPGVLTYHYEGAIIGAKSK